jgi:hypothetical protein
VTIPFPAHAWPLMRSALAHIADHPEEFDMAWFVHRNHCGTTACLAGRIALIHNPKTDYASSFSAMRALGISNEYDDYLQMWDDPVAGALDEVFQAVDIATYEELTAALLARFTFPEPLPVPSGVTV